MAVPYFNPHSLNSYAEKTYDPVISNSGSVLTDCSQHSGVAFGMEVQQTAANSYLNTSNPYGESFHNPFSDYRFPKVLVRVLYHQEPKPSEPPGLSNKNKAQHSDENILYTSQSGVRIDHVWSMAITANSHSINANHSPLDSTLKDSAENGSSGTGRSTPQISSVVDNTSQKQSEKRKAYQKDYQKAYRQSDKGQASRKAYEQSEQRKASRKAYRQSDKGQAASKAYQKAYQKAYREVFNKTGDKEQAKIAGKQASALIKKSNKTKKSELESISISPLIPRISG